MAQNLMESYPPVTLADLKKAADSTSESACCFDEASFVWVSTPTGEAVRIDLVRRKTNLGHKMACLVCPTCRFTCRVLRMVPRGDPPLMCARCVRRVFKAKYRSQLKRNKERTVNAGG